jgi:hypothetical protein
VAIKKQRGTVVCHQVTDADCTVSLHQTGPNRFNVLYGLQVKEGLNYNQAAMEYGSCIMHSLTCAGRIDKRKR